MKSYASKLHIWDVISAKGDTLLKVSTANFTSKMCIDTPNECLIEIIDVYYPDGWIW